MNSVTANADFKIINFCVVVSFHNIISPNPNGPLIKVIKIQAGRFSLFAIIRNAELNSLVEFLAYSAKAILESACNYVGISPGNADCIISHCLRHSWALFWLGLWVVVRLIQFAPST